MSHDDAMSLSMFWAGVLMVFTPIVFAGIVVGVWWWQRRRTLSDEQRATGDGLRATGDE